MKKIRLILNFLVVCIVTNSVNSQTLPEVVPDSPEAAAFIKYGDTQVNLYTGRPNINIPIYNIQGKGISVPINLSYDASGIKVDQIATWVGLGWNLNYGGVVTRKINGLPDRSLQYNDMTSTMVRGAYQIFEQEGFSITGGFSTSGQMSSIMQLVDNYEIGNADIEADTFNFTVNELSGTIGIDYNTTIAGKYRVFCLDDPTIFVDYTEFGGRINQWIITDSNGIKYTFGKAEVTRYGYSVSGNEYNNEYNSAWYLTKIESATSDDTINYYYTNESFWTTPQPQFKNEIKEYAVDPCNNNYSSPITTSNQDLGYSIKQFDLYQITHNGSTVLQTETSATNRLDLSGKKSLKKILIKNKNGNTIKEVEFVQDYFHSVTPLATIDELNHRLKLDQLIIFPSNAESQIYSFEYFDENALAPRNSGSRDYWGNYNGSASTTMVAGNNDEFNYLRTANLGTFHSGNRTPNLSFLRRGTLNKLTYPTGGSSEYFYHLATSDSYIESSNPNNDIIFSFTGEEVSANSSEITAFYSDANGLCDDVYSGNGAIPKVLHHLINIDSVGANKNITIKSTLSSNYIQNNPFNPTAYSIYYLYKSNTPKSYCQLRAMSYSNDPNLIRYGNWTSEQFAFNREEGNYYITLFSDQPDQTITWEYTLPSITQQTVEYDNIGALSLYKIIERDNINNTILRTKYYYYTNIGDKFNFELFDPNYQGPGPEDPEFDPVVHLKQFLEDENYESSGIAHQKMLFSKIVRETEMKVCGTNSEQRLTTEKLQLHSYNLAPKSRYDIAYSTVTELAYSDDGFEGYTIYDFYNQDEGLFYQLAPIYNPKPLNGKLLSMSKYNSLNEILQKEENEYYVSIIEDYIPYNGIVLTPELVNINLCRSLTTDGGISSLTYQDPVEQYCNGAGQLGTYTEYFANRYRLYRKWERLHATKSTLYFMDQSNVSSTVNYSYDNLDHYQTTEVETINSKGETITSKNYYPGDVTSSSSLGYNNFTASELSAIDLLKIQRRISIPVQTETIISTAGSSELSKTISRTNFATWSNNLVLPKSINTLKKGNSTLNTLEERITYYDYDDSGNLLEVSKTNGTHVVYIWGYDNKYPVAKIENATYSQIEALSAFGSGFSIINGLTTTQENALREMSNALVTTYAYEHLIGITSMTDPRGYTMYYEYDNFNRLKWVKDSDGNILSENEYHYKSQN